MHWITRSFVIGADKKFFSTDATFFLFIEQAKFIEKFKFNKYSQQIIESEHCFPL